ncbi:MAG: pre-16S rRNA-processing nuclease YqgF [Candidatus Pacebacteria bacterium]|nr:pre-16S rRNA-processing nuclease YqgF [Candidatus Paceibacterota bacterium]
MENRILGIDYGTKRIGIAVSDPARQFALPLVVVKNTELAIREVEEIARQHEVTEIVMGESRNYKQEPNAVFEEADAFKKQLEGLGLTVYLELEFMTSMQAERFQGKTDLTDASAAALILQSYLDRQEKDDWDIGE